MALLSEVEERKLEERRGRPMRHIKFTTREKKF